MFEVIMDVPRNSAEAKGFEQFPLKVPYIMLHKYPHTSSVQIHYRAFESIANYRHTSIPDSIRQSATVAPQPPGDWIRRIFSIATFNRIMMPRQNPYRHLLVISNIYTWSAMWLCHHPVQPQNLYHRSRRSNRPFDCRTSPFQ